MRFEQIIVVKESLHNEKRVSLTPKNVAQLVNRGHRILVEKEAGLGSGFTDDDYIHCGAKIFSLSSSGFPLNSFIVRILRPSKERELTENKFFHNHTAMLGFLFPFIDDNHIATWQKLGITTLSFDLFKSLSIDDPKNAQAAMSRIAGRLALRNALEFYKGKKQPKLMVVGAGAAGVSAALEGIKNNMPVQLFGRKDDRRAQLLRSGIDYYVLPDSIEKQVDFLRPYLREADIVVTAARIPGKKAPLLINEESLKYLHQGAIIVDLAASNGGNVSGTEPEQIVMTKNGIPIINVSGYPKAEPRTSSEAYSECVFSLLSEIMSIEGEVSFQNTLVQEIWVTHQGRRHDSLYEKFDMS